LNVIELRPVSTPDVLARTNQNMDTNMEDVGRAPEPSRLPPATEPASIPTLDGWIESLMSCKQLAEIDVQRLCERVCDIWRILSIAGSNYDL